MVVQCLASPVGHEDHVFLKVSVGVGEDNGFRDDVDLVEASVADQLAVMDSMQFFQLGE